MKLNIGSGPRGIDGYISVDRRSGGEACPVTLPDAPLDAEGNKIPVPSDSVEEILASHVLEHFSHRDTVGVLDEWVRVLQPGGVLKIAVPDLDRCIAARAEGIQIPFEHYLMGSHGDENDQHGALFDEHTTVDLMRAAGLRNIRRWKHETHRDCSTLPISLNLQGTKRGPVDVSRTIAVMSVPRLGFTENARCAVETFGKLRIPMNSMGGVFWDKVLTHGIQRALEAGADYILTVDYDTIFDSEAVEELRWLLDTNPDFDAVCPVQIQRSKNRVLSCLSDEDGNKLENPKVGDLEKEIHRSKTGHFGLTLFRASVFKELELPWFKTMYDDKGEWYMDPDIFFWHRLESAGKKLGLATHVSVGHLQAVVVWSDQGFRPIFQYGNDYREEGPPPNVRR